MWRAFVGVAVVLLPAVARADIMPYGAKSLTMTAIFEGKVPRGKAVVVSNTWDGVTPLVPGVVSGRLAWHPFDGRMRLRLVDAEEVREPTKRGGRKPRGVVCGEPFDGYRLAPETSPADEVRFVFKVVVKGEECEGTLVRTDFLDRKGERVTPGDLSIDDLPEGPPEVPTPEGPRDMLAVAEAEKGAPASAAAAKEMPTPKELLREVTPAAIQAQGCGCGVTDAGAAWMVALLGLRRRRSRWTTRRV
jgi:hypothetical protein